MNLRISCFLMFLLACAPAMADVYKSVDPSGNVIYSDKPSPNAEKVELGELPTVPAFKAEGGGAPAGDEEGDEAPAGPIVYKRVEITSPANDTPFRMEADNLNLPVTVSVDPPLFGADTLVLFLDGKEYASGHGLVFQLTNLERGTHELRALVRGPDGKTLASSATSTFHVLLRTENQPKSTVGTPPKPPK